MRDHGNNRTNIGSIPLYNASSVAKLAEIKNTKLRRNLSDIHEKSVRSSERKFPFQPSPLPLRNLL